MKERLREMEKWWNEVATEDDDGEDLDSENDLAVEDPKVLIPIRLSCSRFFVISCLFLYILLYLHNSR